MSFYDAIRVGASGASRDLEIQRSLRFNDGDSANLTRTSSSTSNTFTYSAWIKRTHFSGYQYIFSIGGKGFAFHANNNTFYLYDGTNLNESAAKFRDPTAWYHVLVQVNSGTATSYINNVLVHNAVGGGAFTLTTGTDETRIGNYAPTYYYFDGYMAEVNLVDGLVLAPDSFAKTDEVTGQWIPQKYVGAYGTNGFRITFADNSGTTATTLGKDESGNGNNFTPNNFSVAANLSNDSMPDTPSNNFCTLNNINASSSINFGNLDGNLVFDQTSNDQAMTGTFFISPQTGGKWYWEIYKNASQNPEIGIAGPQTRLSARGDGIIDERLAFITNGGNLRTGSSSNQSITGGSAQTGAGWIRIACDMDNKKIWFSDTSGNYFNSGNPATGANPAYDFSSHATKDGWTPYVFMGTGGGHNCYVNFGQFDLNSFSSNIPTGFKTLTSENLPDPTVKIPNKHFDTFLYTATGNAMSFTGLNFQPDWIWQKRRDNVGSSHFHYLFDAIRGGTQGLQSNTTGAEFTASDPNITFTSNGYDMAATSGGQGNGTGGSYVSWNWNAGDTDGKTYTVKVVSDSGNKYRFDDFGTSAVTLDLAEGGTYIFNMDDSSNASHPFSIGTAANGTVYTSGITYFLDGVSKTYSEYTSGFAAATTRRLHITVPASAPQLYYWCSIHSGMGGAINTNSTLGSSNFDGSIQTTVKANTSAGFSIVGYTGTNGNGTIGHGLGVAPKFVIVRRRPNTSDWAVYHEGLGNSVRLVWNSTSGASNASASWWQNTSPTSSIVYLGNDAGHNGSTDTYIAYCFSEVEGFSKFGFYKGNNNANGTFIFTGFRPAWVMIKNRHRSSAWYILDNKRDPDNPAQEYLAAEDSAAEGTYVFYDFLANGFKLRNVGNAQNADGENIVFFAFAEAPFKYSRAR